MVINHKVYLYKPDGTTFLGELIVDSLKADLKLQDISTISFRIPEVINGQANPRIDEVLDSYIIELWYGKVDGVYANGDFKKIRFRIYSTPLEFSEYQYLHSYAGYSIESDLEFKRIISWPGIQVKDFFRTITYNNSAGSPAFTETGFSYNISTSANTVGTKYITIDTTDEPTALDIFIYEIRENSANNSESEVSLIELTSGDEDSNDFKAGYYYLNKTGDIVDSVSIALPDNYTTFNGSSTATLSYKFYDNPVARAFAVGIKTNTSEPLSNMYLDLAQDAAEGSAAEYGGYTFTSQSIYSKNGLKLEDILDGGDNAADGILYNSGFSVGTITATIAAKYRSNIDFNNITLYQAIKEIAESFESVAIFDTINKTVSFYAENEYGSNNDLVIKYATYLKSISKEIDASKIITNARALGKDNIKITLVNPTASEVWEDYSYFLDDYYIEYTEGSTPAGFTIVADGTNGLDITYPDTSAYQSRWMSAAEALKIGKWQYTRDYFHYVLSNDDATVVDSSHNTYKGLYDERSEAINLYVKYETQYEKKKADEYKYFYLVEHYRDLYENKGTNLSEYQYYQAKYNTAVAQAADFKTNVLDVAYDNLYDATTSGTLAYKFAQVQSFLDKSNLSINTTELRTFQRETVHNDTKIDNEVDLLNATKIYVDENKEPRVTFNISIIDVLEAEEAYDDWDKFVVGEKLYVYFPAFNIDLQAQIREISIDFQGKTLSIVVSTVRNYNRSFGSFLVKNIVKFNNANLNTVLYYKDGTDASITQTESVRNTLNNGIDAGQTSVNTGAVDSSTGQTSTTTSGEGQKSRVVTAVDLYTETLTLGEFTTGVKISDGRLLTFKPFDVDDVEWTQEVEVSAENGFVIRRVYGDNTVTKLAYIDADDGSAYFAGWELEPGQLSSGATSSFVGINSETPTTGNSLYAFWAGDETASSAPFSVSKTGNIVATEGSIAGLTMTESGGVVKLYAGTGTWNHNNTPFYLDSTGKFSLEDQISWDPSTDTLNIAGGISAQYGEIGGWTVDAKRLYAGSSTTRVELNSDSESDYAIFAGNETAASAPFSVTKDGDLLATSATITGTINATSGTFNNTITVGTDTDQISIVGASTAAGTKIYSGAGTYNNANTGFYLDAAGKFSLGDQLYWDGAGNLQILGNLVADTGTIGGFTITDDTIQQGADTSKLALQSDGTNPFLTIGQATNGYNETGIFLGLDSGVSKLSLKSGTNSLLFDGTNLSITGAITSSSGTIGGWTIGASSFSGGDATLASSGNLTLGTSDDVVKLSADDATYRLWAGNATAGSAPFRVDKDGNLVATAATITGAITATSGSFTGAITSTSGEIGGWTIGANSLTGGDATLNSSGNLTLGTSDDVVRLSANDSTYRVWVGNATAASAPFSVDKDGNIKSSAGSIGNWSISSTSLKKTYNTNPEDGSETDPVNIYAGELPSALQATAGAYGFAVENTNPDTDEPFLAAMTSKGFFIYTDSGSSPETAMEISYDEDYIWAKRLVISDVKNFTTANVTIGTLGENADNWGLVVNNGTSTDGSSITIDKDGIEIIKTVSSNNTTTFSVDTSGNVSVKGDLTASTGTFGATNAGHVILGDSSNPLTIKDDTTTYLNLTSAGVLTFAGFTASDAALYTGTKSTLASNDAGVYIATDGIALGTNSPFKVTSAGALTASSGTVGGWTLDTDAIYTGTKTGTGSYTSIAGHVTIGSDGHISAKEFRIDADGNAFFAGDISAATGTFGSSIAIGSGDSIFKADSNGIYLGDADFADAEFSVTPAGLLKAVSGTVGGWTLGASSLTGGNATLASSGNLTLGTSDDVVRLSADDATYRLWAGHATAASAPFRVDKDGNLVATAATITGAINATSGTFNNTITVGTNTDKIYIVGANTAQGTKIYSGAGNYKNIDTGFYLDADGRFSLGDQLYWDGSTLEIVGNLIADTGSIGGWNVGTSTITSSNVSNVSVPEIQLQKAGKIVLAGDGFDGSGIMTNPKLTIDGTATGSNAMISSDNFKINYDGSATFGKLNVGTDGSIASTDNSFSISAAGAATFAGALSAATGSFGDTTINGSSTLTIGTYQASVSGDIKLSNASGIVARDSSNTTVFSVSTSGALVATNATITGTITATDGRIGSTTDGWDINANTLESKNDYIKLDAANNKILVGNIALQGDAAGNNSYIGLGKTSYALSGTAGIYAGLDNGVAKLSIGDTTNSLTWDGSALSVTGTVTATDGEIGGWEIGASSLTGGNATLASSGNLTLGTSNDVVRLSADDATYRIWAGNATAASAPFSVTKAGAFKATSGEIAGWSISTDNLNSNGLELYSGSSPYISIGQSTNGYNQEGIFLGLDSSVEKFSITDSTLLSELTFEESFTYSATMNISNGSGTWTTDAPIYNATGGTSTTQGFFNIEDGATTSAGTGPSGPYQGTRFMYYESSGTSSLTRDLIFTYTSTTTTLNYISFYYHMYGSSTTSLTLYRNGTTEILWQKTGDQGDKWYEATVPVISGTSTLRFRVVGDAGGFTSDISLDHIRVYSKLNKLSFDPNSGLYLAGNITATSGEIGGFDIGANQLTSGFSSTRVGVSDGSTTSSIAFYAGSETATSAPFRVSNTGALTTTSGFIGEWSINSTGITSPVAFFDDGGGTFYNGISKLDDGWMGVYESSGTINSTTPIYYIHPLYGFSYAKGANPLSIVTPLVNYGANGISDTGTSSTYNISTENRGITISTELTTGSDLSLNSANSLYIRAGLSNTAGRIYVRSAGVTGYTSDVAMRNPDGFGSTSTHTQISSKIVKENFETIEDANILEFLDKIEIKKFNYKSNKYQHGVSFVIEDEIEKQTPFINDMSVNVPDTAVFDTFEDIPEYLKPYNNTEYLKQKEDGKFYYSSTEYSTTNLAGVSLASIQLNHRRIKELEEENKKLKEEIALIKQKLGL